MGRVTMMWVKNSKVFCSWAAVGVHAVVDWKAAALRDSATKLVDNAAVARSVLVVYVHCEVTT